MAPSATEQTASAAKGHVQEEHRSGDPSLAFVRDEESLPPVFTDKYEERKFLKHRLALAYRIFAQNGFADGVAGHITLRDPVDPTSFWVNPFGLHFSLIKDEDLIRVDHTGTVVEGGNNLRLNYEIHNARPDVLCAAHCHSIYGGAMCSTGRTLDMLTQDFCVFYEDHAYYPNFAGLVLATDEGREIAECLGPRKAALLGNHGLLTAGPTIEATIGWFVLLEKLCKVQLAADASSAGSGRPLVTIGEAESRSTHAAIGHGDAGYFMGLPLFQVAEREFGEQTYLGRGLRPI
ncbi:class 2 aldolase adducin domain containing protein [Grosmannia clavigera kw1407]|uniref:Class 2 aldolase adducin domain containing protein n=1 Tax=Grosmannia clavigera (strain kw1407 / UAMH 11150) TaxID=655863 RepID=F0XJ68_GROCL|nr:class 2 aldolase adducin domain containing protein [Grosmannia clavigera kw1407]EFX02177.1 class 2 aldolase adducin domain containing protein [Grosmannia clavigera kw1407]